MAARLGIGVVGLGRMGAMHARYVARGVPGAKVVAVADFDTDRARAMGAELDVANVFGSAAELAACREVDAVLLATPSVRHPDDVIAAASAGKDVLCEKPLSLEIEGSVAALAVVEQAGVRLQVGLMRRHDPDYLRAADRLARGVVGRPVLFKSLQFDPEPPALAFCDPKVSGGIFLDMGIHEFDLARWLMDDEVVEVHAWGSTAGVPELASVGDYDSAVVNLRFARGGTGSVEMARTTVYGEDVRTEVVGSDGSVFIGRLPYAQGSFGTRGTLTIDAVDPAQMRFATAYAAQVEAFVSALADDRPVTPTGEDALAALRISLAARASAEQGRPVGV
ncbi:MAG TPA: Gfo/Idh/MocA family oxidoreductase [Acidimicrobiales bacterium]|nr:Gfo/Idh/MocA family oxidoreductase [Acidimicrobiales bacterium]